MMIQAVARGRMARIRDAKNRHPNGEAPADRGLGSFHVDPNELREKLDMALMANDVPEEKDTAEDLPLFWTQSARFNVGVGLVVVVNGLIIGFETDYGSEHPEVFNVLENMFCAIFTIEICLHLKVEGPFIYFSERINWIDCFLVLLSIADVWVLSHLSGGGPNMKSLALLRLLRLMRLARLLRVMRAFKELTLLITGLFQSVAILSWAFILFFVIIYTCAIFMRTAVGDEDTCVAGRDPPDCSVKTAPYYSINPDIGDQYSMFGRVDVTMLTLFFCITEGCGMEIVRPLVTETPLLICFWIPFIFFTTFGMLNLIVGIFCENALANSQAQELDLIASREHVLKDALEDLLDAFSSMDVDQTGTISREELEKARTENKRVRDALEVLGLEHEPDLFDTLDAEGLGEVTFENFSNGTILIAKGQDAARAKDIVGIHLLSRSSLRTAQQAEEDAAVVRKGQRKLEREILKAHCLCRQALSEAERAKERCSELALEAKELKRAVRRQR